MTFSATSTTGAITAGRDPDGPEDTMKLHVEHGTVCSMPGERFGYFGWTSGITSCQTDRDLHEARASPSIDDEGTQKNKDSDDVGTDPEKLSPNSPCREIEHAA